jgi:hypothetical protein
MEPATFANSIETTSASAQYFIDCGWRETAGGENHAHRSLAGMVSLAAMEETKAEYLQRIGRAGGKSRARTLSSERRSAIARLGAQKRWKLDT